MSKYGPSPWAGPYSDILLRSGGICAQPKDVVAKDKGDAEGICWIKCDAAKAKDTAPVGRQTTIPFKGPKPKTVVGAKLSWLFMETFHVLCSSHFSYSH